MVTGLITDVLCHLLYCPKLFIDTRKMELRTKVATKVEETELFNGEFEMEESDEEKYLGDLITSNGLNKKNINARKGKNMVLLRRLWECYKKFLSSDLLNSEAWYALSLADVEQLEMVDQALLKRILEMSTNKIC